MISLQIPLTQTYDVIVLGGGPTGCTAAIASAREGAKTLLIEASGMLGGSGTSALVPAWCPFSDKEKAIYRGLGLQILEACKAHQPHVKSDALDWVPIDAERLKEIYDEFVTQSGAEILFHTQLCALQKDERGHVESVVVANKSGLSAFGAQVFVDCTGDADLCALSGADFLQGDESGDLMPATHCFLLTNVDEYAFNTLYKGGNAFHSANPASPLYKIIDSGEFPLIPDAHFCCNLVGPRTVGFNAGHMWNVDNTDPASTSRALVHGRRMAREYQRALAKFAPEAFASAWLVATGSQVGIRETRRVTGDYVLTLDDYLARRSFDDEICRNSYFIDIHHALADAEKNVAQRREGLKNEIRYRAGESHGIPFRCLIPRDLENVLVAGRSISCERIVQGSVRVMPVCLAMGEAAGMGAALSLEHSGDVRAVDVSHLRARLRDEGAYLPEEVSSTKPFSSTKDFALNGAQ